MGRGDNDSEFPQAITAWALDVTRGANRDGEGMGVDGPVTDDDVACLRCGKRSEVGFVTAVGSIDWSTRGTRARWSRWGDEMLARTRWAPRVLVAAHRCRRCRFVWFET